MAFRSPQSNFSKGEIGPQLYGRYDVDAWRSAVKRARNVVVMKFGGLEKRPGFEIVSEVLEDDASNNVRLIPFQFSSEQAYAIEMGQAYFAMSAFGGRVLEDELAITNITSASQAVVTVAYHGYEAGNLVYIEGVDGEMGDVLNGQFWRVVSVVDADNFKIDVNTGDVFFTGATGGATNSAPPTPTPTPVVPPPSPPSPPPRTGGGGGGGGRYPGFDYHLE